MLILIITLISYSVIISVVYYEKLKKPEFEITDLKSTLAKIRELEKRAWILKYAVKDFEVSKSKKKRIKRRSLSKKRKRRLKSNKVLIK